MVPGSDLSGKIPTDRLRSRGQELQRQSSARDEGGYLLKLFSVNEHFVPTSSDDDLASSPLWIHRTKPPSKAKQLLQTAPIHLVGM